MLLAILHISQIFNYTNINLVEYYHNNTKVSINQVSRKLEKEQNDYKNI